MVGGDRSAMNRAADVLARASMPLAVRIVDALAGPVRAHDLQALNSAIEVEGAAVAAYAAAAATGLLSPAVASVAAAAAADHRARREAFVTGLTACGVEPPHEFPRPDYSRFECEADVLAGVLSVEHAAVTTYLSLVLELGNRDLAFVAASILDAGADRIAEFAAALDNALTLVELRAGA